MYWIEYCDSPLICQVSLKFTVQRSVLIHALGEDSCLAYKEHVDGGLFRLILEVVDIGTRNTLSGIG